MMFNELKHQIQNTELKKVRVYIQMKLTSGEGAVQITLDGFPIGGSYNFGGSEQIITIYVDLFIKGDIEAGIIFTQKQIESGCGSIVIGANFGSPEISKSTDYYFTTDSGTGVTKNPWNTSGGTVGFKNTDFSVDSKVNTIEIVGKLGLIFVGAGLTGGIQYHWW